MSTPHLWLIPIACTAFSCSSKKDDQSTASDAQTAAPTAVAIKHAPLTFPQGATAGEVTHESAVIWARAARRDNVVALVEAGELKKVYSQAATEARDLTVAIPIDGLPSGTPITVKLWLEEHPVDADAPPPAAPGDATMVSFSTAPKPSEAQRVRFAFGGDLGGQNFCRDKDKGYQIFDTIRNDGAFDFFIGLGDMVYADGDCRAVGLYGNFQIPARFSASQELEDFRAHHRYNREAPNLRQLLAQTPYFATLDDHETANDVDARHPLFKNGRQAFLDYAPLARTEDDTIYRSVRWGKHLELFILDTRSYRHAASDEDAADQNKSMLGDKQRTWLIDGLKKSDATWKVVVSSVPISIPTGAHDAHRDGWASGTSNTGYERELRNLFDAIRDTGADKTLWLSADVHFATGFSYKPFDGDDFEVDELIVGPLAAGIFPVEAVDDTFSPTRLFMHAPKSPDAVQGYEQAVEWLNYGSVEIDEAGKLTALVKNALGKEIYKLELGAPSSAR